MLIKLNSHINQMVAQQLFITKQMIRRKTFCSVEKYNPLFNFEVTRNQNKTFIAYF